MSTTRRTGKKSRWEKGRPKPASRPSSPRSPRRQPRASAKSRRGLGAGTKVALVIGAGLVALVGVYLAGGADRSPTGGAFAYAVGSPGPGETAPPISLPSTAGGDFDLGSMRGKTVLLYFQEGLMCHPCWDQIVDIEAEMDRFTDIGIDEMVTITTDPLDALQQKVADEGITTPVLSDPDLAVSLAYDTNSYGMMGDSRNGHSFIVVGPDGDILWRADYGGAPDYTMYLPVTSLLADLRQGLDED